MKICLTLYPKGVGFDQCPITDVQHPQNRKEGLRFWKYVDVGVRESVFGQFFCGRQKSKSPEIKHIFLCHVVI